LMEMISLHYLTRTGQQLLSSAHDVSVMIVFTPV
jgi:hypothetical protein